MTKQEKIDTLANETTEVCYKILVHKGAGTKALEALQDTADRLGGVVIAVYNESPETHDLEEVVDDISEETFRRITRGPQPFAADRPLLDSEVVNPCSKCKAPVFRSNGDGELRDYESQAPHTCPDGS